MAEGNIALQMTRVTMVTAVFAIVSVHSTNIQIYRLKGHCLFSLDGGRLSVWGLQ
jgi:hypothetical protein